MGTQRETSYEGEGRERVEDGGEGRVVDAGGGEPPAGDMADRHGSDEDRYPRAPTQEEWDAMSPEERERVVAALPGKVMDTEPLPLEPDEVIADLKHLIRGLQRRVDEEAQRVARAERRAEEEARLRREEQRRVAELQAELERLKAR